MKKILIGYIIDGETGGIDRYLTNLLKRIPFDNEEVQVDFLTNHITQQVEKNFSQYNNVNVYEIATLKHPIKQFHQTVALIKRNKYDITYFNISTALHCIGAIAAKKCGVKKRIIHAHASGIDSPNKCKREILTLINSVCKIFLHKQGTDFCACSQTAGAWLFPQKVLNSKSFKIIKNAIDTRPYVFSSTKREEIRRALNLENKLVVGHVGSFNYSKNHEFLLKIFEKLHLKNPQSVLMLVGDGPLYEQIVQRAKLMGLDDCVLFMGKRNDTNNLMQAMDVFVLPSNFEGLGIVGVEAQVSGLPCIFSDRVPSDVVFTNNCSFLAIDKDSSASEWAENILNIKSSQYRTDAAELAEKAGYSMQVQDISFLLD